MSFEHLLGSGLASHISTISCRVWKLDLRIKEGGVCMRIAAIQMCCEVGNVTANLSNANRLIRSASESGAEFVCTPELFTTGIVSGEMENLAEPIPGPTTRELSRIAEANSVYLVAILRIFTSPLTVCPLAAWSA